MQCQGRLLARKVCGHLGHNSVPAVKPSILQGASRSFRLEVRKIHYTAVKSTNNVQGEPPVSTSSSLQIADDDLKIASASGGIPPEDPEDPTANHSPSPEENSKRNQRPTFSDSFARPHPGRGRLRISSSRRNAQSQRRPKSPSLSPQIPEWFLRRNVSLFKSLNQPVPANQQIVNIPGEKGLDNVDSDSNGSHTRFPISPFVRKELEAHLSAALLLQSNTLRTQDNLSTPKTHVHLHCPKRGTIYFLDEAVENAARQLGADVVRFDAQDLDELLENLIDPNQFMDSALADPQIFITSIVDPSTKETGEKEDSAIEEDATEFDDEEDSTEGTPDFRVSPPFPGRLMRLFFRRMLDHSPGINSAIASPEKSLPSGNYRKIARYLDLLAGSAKTKRRMAWQSYLASHPESLTKSSIPSDNDRTIIYLRDFQSIMETNRGRIAHQTLLTLVNTRRKLGQEIVIAVSDDLPGESIALSLTLNQHYHAIKIPPPTSDAEKSILQKDRDARIREINLRSIQSAIRQRSRSPSMEFDCPPGVHLDAYATAGIPGLSEEVWALNKVQRVASVALGNHGKWLVQHSPQQVSPMTLFDIAQALDTIHKVDQERAEVKQEPSAAREVLDPPGNSPSSKREKPSVSQISPKDCNKHEQRLLAGVIDPEKINVGFSDICAPESTIQTLRVLVALPLKRPDAFSYGVLSKNFINGVLLFGPPGTGKTMLAKAVAKESGARVLEIKGSEVYDMYVGEGEKNVKAIFSLARKLSPCVVFIDEVDTIFSSRNSTERHVSHREIINQFMAEWDGINALNSGVLILGATNRPFDLDDAILRRMPRRILVDLPTEKDRLTILKLLLADEMLDPAVDLNDLAKKTNLYSGSDLKNVCVSAAIAAVTEEQPSIAFLNNDTDNPSHPSHQSDASESVEISQKRVLRPGHFENALTEVTASISESMETIELLRKFDRQYGKSTDKKKQLMGFGTEAPESVANVRI